MFIILCIALDLEYTQDVGILIYTPILCVFITFDGFGFDFPF